MTRSADIQALFQQGERIERPALLVLWRRTEAPRRVGFAVSRQVGGAVRRNRARRRLREAFRIARGAAPARVELLVVARSGVLAAPFAALTEQLREALGAIPGPRP